MEVTWMHFQKWPLEVFNDDSQFLHSVTVMKGHQDGRSSREEQSMRLRRGQGSTLSTLKYVNQKGNKEDYFNS